MANNRLYIRCKVCGDTHFIGRDGGCNWMTDVRFYGFEKRADEFFNDIYNQHEDCYIETILGEGLFEIITETEMERNN